MRIGLIDVDGHNWPSIPLMKISAYHKRRGDDVEEWFPMSHYDKVYMSKVFTTSQDVETVIYADEIERGSTGYFYPDGGPSLPEEIEHIYPDYGLYESTTKGKAFGFLTRGCPRNCPFCIVSKKEGASAHRVADLSEFWRGQREIKLLDPNILACVEREALLRQLADSGAAVDFTQGLDIRLVEGAEKLIADIKVKRLHFAWDNPEQNLRPYFEKFKQKSGLPYWKMGVYVLTNFNSSHEQDLERVYYLRELGYDPYIMIFEKETAPRETRLLQRYVNNKLIFRSCAKFEDYDPKRGVNMSVCKGCGATLEWIDTAAGRSMPVDSEPVFVIEGEGRDRFITDEGEVIIGRRALPEEERRELPVAFVPHWKTCTAADSFRRRQ